MFSFLLCLFLHLIICLTTCQNLLIKTILTNGQTDFGLEITQVELIEVNLMKLIWSFY